MEEKIKSEMPYLTYSIDTLEKIVPEDRTHLYYLLTAKFGIQFYNSALQWCEEAKASLTETLITSEKKECPLDSYGLFPTSYSLRL